MNPLVSISLWYSPEEDELLCLHAFGMFLTYPRIGYRGRIKDIKYFYIGEL